MSDAPALVHANKDSSEKKNSRYIWRCENNTEYYYYFLFYFCWSSIYVYVME